MAGSDDLSKKEVNILPHDTQKDEQVRYIHPFLPGLVLCVNHREQITDSLTKQTEEPQQPPQQAR